MSRRLRYGVLAAVALVGASATAFTTVSAGGRAATAPSNSDIDIEVVTHGQASDPFWSVFKSGVEDAGAQMGVTANYSSPATYDMVAMSQLIDAAVAKNPDGLVVSVPDYDALKDSLAAARDAGIPIITANAGSDHYQEIGAITHVGQDETISGEAAGQRLVDAGATHVLCIIHEVGNLSLDARCAGAKTAIEAAGGTITNVQTDLNDAAGSQSTISSTLQADDTIDAVLALGPTGALPALAAIEEVGKTGDIIIGSFDLNQEVIQAIIDGKILFTVDQQEYLQGYLPIVFLTLYHNNLNTVGGGQPVLTGPGFVTADNAQQVLDLAGQGTR